jgi:hypothetical protein
MRQFGFANHRALIACSLEVSVERRSIYGRHVYLNLLCDKAGGELLGIIDQDPSVSKCNQTTCCDPLVFGY